MIFKIFGWLLGIVFILGGVGFALMVFGAVSMASRSTTNSELLPALLGVIPIIIGVFIIAAVMR